MWGALNVSVIPDILAKAGIGNPKIFNIVDSRFRGNDNIENCHNFALRN
jgi:hypothetical protein